MPLWNRIYRLTVAPEAGGEGVEITDLRISFQIEKSRTEQANTALIKLWNASPDTRALMEEAGMYVQLEAGYSEEAGLELLFVGDITIVSHAVNPPDVVSTIQAGDGQKAIREAWGAFSFAAGSTATEILESVAAEFGLTVRDMPELEDEEYASGFAHVGPLRDAMNELTKRLGAEWSIQNGEVQVTKQKTALEGEAVVLSPTTGLLGTPERISEIDAADLSATQPPPGWKLRSLLMPRIEPGGAVQIESVAVEGLFTVEKCTYIGDTRGEQWFCEIEVLEESA